ISQPEPKKSEKKVEAVRPADAAVNGVTVQLKSTSLAAKEAAPVVQIEVTEHEETEGDTHTKVQEVTTTKTDENSVEEMKEVSTVSTTSAPGGRQTFEKRETTSTVKKKFVDPELQQRMGVRQR
ncbi:hypothetical protein, partial [Salmonella sp. s54412]|uniref:hypothetical protein n=1 Tax=Salmonella sp. s54412 TaxID=3160128 RepID=UPI003754C43F